MLSQQVAGQARSEGAGALHTGPAHRPQLAGPDEQPPVAGRRAVWTDDDGRRHYVGDSPDVYLTLARQRAAGTA